MSGDDWTKGNREREVLYAQQRLHGANIDGGTESVSIPVEDFGGWAHARLKEASDAFDSESALTVSREWEKLATGFKSVLDNFKSSLDAAINGSWSGEGAEAAKEAISNYKSHAEKVSDGMSLMATKPAEVETAMTQVKGLMPEVVQVHQPQERTQAAYEQYYAQQALAQQK
ncbi:PPE domain-containing protein, partial [Mycobacteroides chelonae]